jgi:hypothetical protein
MKDSELKELIIASEGLKIFEDNKKRIAAIDAEKEALLAKNAENNDAQTVVLDNMDEAENFRIALLNEPGAPEYIAFDEKWKKDNKDNPWKNDQDAKYNAWVQHCHNLRLGVEEPLADQTPNEDVSEIKLSDADRAHLNMQQRKPLQTRDNPRDNIDGRRQKTGLTAGRYLGKNKAGEDIYESDEKAEKDSHTDTGINGRTLTKRLTVGRFTGKAANGKDVWETNKDKP